MRLTRHTPRLGAFPTSYDEAVSAWKQAVADFTQAYAEFLGYQGDAQADPDTASAWQTLNDRALTAQAGIRDIAVKLQNAGTAVGNFFDSAGNVVANAVEYIFGMPSYNLQGLGIAPVVIGIGIAAVIGATAYLGGVISDLLKFNNIMAQARSQGLNTAQTISLLEGAGISGSSFFGTMGLGTTILLAGAAIYFLPQLLRKIK